MMKIISLNLQAFTNWEARKPAILEYLQAESPDIILFQEVVFIPNISPYNQVQLLNETLRYPYEQSAITRLQPSHVYSLYREGLASLSNYPVTKSDTVILQQAEGDEHNRIVQLLDFEIDGRSVKIANVHYSITDFVDFATAHLQETLEILASHNEERIIIGDFNLDDLNKSKHLWGEKYFCSNEVDYISFPRLNKRNDYALIPKSYTFETIATSGDGLSDHRALAIEIK
jgi:endonuclease/exonuclease/phosphatase family metal-dependent hydrolase